MAIRFKLFLLAALIFPSTVFASDPAPRSIRYKIDLGEYGIGISYGELYYTYPHNSMAERNLFFSSSYSKILLHSTYIEIPLSPFYILLLLPKSHDSFIIYNKMYEISVSPKK